MVSCVEIQGQVNIKDLVIADIENDVLGRVMPVKESMLLLRTNFAKPVGQHSLN